MLTEPNSFQLNCKTKEWFTESNQLNSIAYFRKDSLEREVDVMSASLSFFFVLCGHSAASASSEVGVASFFLASSLRSMHMMEYASYRGTV